jgi:hypothetical protein
MSTLHAILLFGGVPLLIIAGIVLFVTVPSLVRGPKYQPGEPWEAQPAMFGSGGDADAPRQISAGEASSDDAAGATGDDATGGASVRW